MRLTLLVLAILMALAACATTSSAPALSEADRCVRYGGYWSYGVCRSQ